MDDGHMSHISRGAAKYRLHTCQHCQALVLDLRSLLDPSNSTRTASGANLSSYSFTGQHTIQAADQGCNFFQFCISNVKVPASTAEPLRTIFPVEDVADELTLEVRFLTKAIESGIKCYCWVSWDRADKAWMGTRFPDLFRWIFEVSVPKGSSHLRLPIDSLIHSPLRILIDFEYLHVEDVRHACYVGAGVTVGRVRS